MTHKKKILAVKIGTSSLTAGSSSLKRPLMLDIVRQIAALRQQGWQLLLVTSGAVAAGRHVLHPTHSARSLPAKQMLSAIGQVALMQTWRDLFAIWEIPIGQLLLTRGDLSVRARFLNVRDTLQALLAHAVLPIINENDSVATDEIKVGDNDNLAALVANVIAADMLVLLTDQRGLLQADPRQNPQAALIPLVEKIDASTYALVGRSASSQGTGGMTTKLQAAQLATQGGTTTIIAAATEKDVLLRLANGERLGTTFLPQVTARESRKRWLLAETVQAAISIDAGAAQKLLSQGASLLPAGISGVPAAAHFERGAIIQLINPEGQKIAVGITNYSSAEIKQIIGLHSKAIIDALGYSYGEEVIHRDNMAIYAQ